MRFEYQEKLAQKHRENRELLKNLRAQVEAGEKVLSYEEMKELMYRPGINQVELQMLYRLSKRMQADQEAGEKESEPVEEKKPVPKVTKEEVDEAFQKAKSSRRPQDIMWYSKLKRLHEEWLRYQEEKCDD